MSYLFVDGGYLTARLREWSERFTRAEPIELDFEAFFGVREKTFYYDALPTQKKSESIEAFAARTADVEALHAKLRSVQGLTYQPSAKRNLRDFCPPPFCSYIEYGGCHCEFPQ